MNDSSVRILAVYQRYDGRGLAVDKQCTGIPLAVYWTGTCSGVGVSGGSAAIDWQSSGSVPEVYRQSGGNPLAV